MLFKGSLIGILGYFEAQCDMCALGFVSIESGFHWDLMCNDGSLLAL